MLCPSCDGENPTASRFCEECGANLAVAAEHDPAVSVPPGSTTGFVGRRREMASLGIALNDALSGHGRLVMRVGEPGIGKTRTAQELTVQAERAGAHVLWGRCLEDAGAPPYWPWVQAAGAYVKTQDSKHLAVMMGQGAADIAEIIPEVQEKLPDWEPPPSLKPEQARFRLFNSTAAFLRNAASAHGLMLVLDDLHRADRPTLLMLQFLARQMENSRLLVVGTYRDIEVSGQHPLSETLAQCKRLPRPGYASSVRNEPRR